MSTLTRPPLDLEALQRRLVAVGYNHVELTDVTGSTSTDLADRIRSGEDLPDMSVLMAEYQSAGRGRKGRSFEAPPRSQIICSVLVRVPEVPVEQISLLPLLTGLSIAEGIQGVTEGRLPVRLKWPNDVVLQGRKMVGILVEAAQVTPHPAIILGFGINYDLQREELPVSHATSIGLELAGVDSGDPSVHADFGADAAPRTPPRLDVAVAVLTQLKLNLDRWRGLGGAPQTILPRYRELSATLGQKVKAYLPGDTVIEGEAIDIDNDGELILSHDGTRTTVRAGEIVHLRPAAGGGYAGDYGPGIGN